MEAIAAILASPAGQALAGAAINQVVSIISGTDPAQAAADFASAITTYQQAIADWKAAEAATPAPDAPKP